MAEVGRFTVLTLCSAAIWIGQAVLLLIVGEHWVRLGYETLVWLAVTYWLAKRIWPKAACGADRSAGGEGEES